MYYVVNTSALLVDGVIDPAQEKEIKDRSRQAMVTLCVNTMLIAGIVAATFGLVFYLADALSVAICGGLFVGAGLLILRYGAQLYRMFGNASALIGAGMLISGSAIELMDKVPNHAGAVMIAMGAIIAGFSLWRYLHGLSHLRFAYGCVLLMGAALHVLGAYDFADAYWGAGLVYPGLHFYAFAVIAACGVLLDVRLITALAIIPFAQVLDTGTGYFHAVYVYYSPESTLTIVQMTVLIGLCIWVATRSQRLYRQAGILAIMAFIVANLSFLVGSLWGDTIGDTWFGPRYSDFQTDYNSYYDAHDAYYATAFTINEHVYSIVWAVILAVQITWAALTNRRGLFNAGMTFAGIHAYTQMFETFYDEPLAYVIGGFAAIPMAFGLWRLNNQWFK